MKNQILINRSVYSNLVKTIILTKKLLERIEDRQNIDKEWLTIEEVTKEYNLSRKVINSYRNKGLKVSQKIANGKILVSRNELEKFIKTK